jgi:hypothetical protein
MEILKGEQTKIVENPQASVVYTRTVKLLDLFGTDISNKARNEGDDRKRVFVAEIPNTSDTPNKLSITNYIDNESMMLYWEDQKGATRIVLDQDTILNVMTYSRNEAGFLALNVEQKTKGKPKLKLKPIDQGVILGQINVLLDRAEDIRNNIDKIQPSDFLQKRSFPRRGLAIAKVSSVI